jgi:hypothetical protein
MMMMMLMVMMMMLMLMAMNSNRSAYFSIFLCQLPRSHWPQSYYITALATTQN